MKVCGVLENYLDIFNIQIKAYTMEYVSGFKSNIALLNKYICIFKNSVQMTVLDFKPATYSP